MTTVVIGDGLRHESGVKLIKAFKPPFSKSPLPPFAKGGRGDYRGE
jgi:hypothetical protein